MHVNDIPDTVKIGEGTYAGDYEYSTKFSTKALLGWYRKDKGGRNVDPHFSVENTDGQFNKFHISFDVGGRNVHFYYKFTHQKGVVEKTGNTGWNDGFSSSQQEKADVLLDQRHKQICHNLAQQFFTSAVVSDFAAQADDARAEFTSKSVMKSLRRTAAFSD